MLSLVLAAMCSFGAADVQLQTLEGEAFTGALKSLDATAIVIETPDGDRSFAPQQVLQVARQPATAPVVQPLRQFHVELVDGSQLLTLGCKSIAPRVALQLDEQRDAEVPQSVLRSLRAASASDSERAAWQQIVDEHQAGDCLVVRKQGALDHVEGIVHQITSDGVQFEIDGETVPVKWTKVFGLIYHRRAGEVLPPAVCRVHLVDGSQLAAQQLALAGDALSVELVAGPTLAVPLSSVDRLDYSQGKIAYLSDLEWDPRQSQRVPFLGPALPLDSELDLFSPQRDRAFDGGPLLLGGKPYAKGLALHSRTKLVYRLPDAFRRFVAIIGIDDRVDTRGHVEFRVEADGRTLFQQELTGSSDPLALDLDIAGVRRLTLLVDYGHDQDISDHLDLCEARLIK